MLKFIKTLLLVFTLSAGSTGFAAEFDHNYTAWNGLLAKHVKWFSKRPTGPENCAE
jgi:hypothetical protein